MLFAEDAVVGVSLLDQQAHHFFRALVGGGHRGVVALVLHRRAVHEVRSDHGGAHCRQFAQEGQKPLAPRFPGGR